MAPRQKGEKKTARSSDGDNEEGMDPKRKCTTSTRATTFTTTSVSVKKEKKVELELEVAGSSNISNNSFVPDFVASAMDPRNATTVTTATTKNNDVDNNKLPTLVELSKKLCQIVDTDHYSRAEACRAMDQLCHWLDTRNSEFLKYFHVYGGIAKVIDFLKETMNDSSCVGSVRMECIEKAGRVISRVCYLIEDNSNLKIVTKITKILTSAIDHNGIHTLLSASDEYSGGDDVPQLKALYGVWAAMRAMVSVEDIVVSQDQATIVFEAGIDILYELKLYHSPVVSGILTKVFGTLAYVVNINYRDKKHFQNKKVLSKCLDVFRMDGTWGDRNEEVMSSAINYFDWCDSKDLLDRSTDYEILLPVLAVGLKKFGLNQHILRNTLNLIHRACKGINDKKVIERSGVMEHLSVLLASKDINEDQKKNIRKTIGNITAP